MNLKLNPATITTQQKLLAHLEAHKNENQLYAEVLSKHYYERELLALQTELVHLQKWIERTQQKVAIIFEGRDAAGKGGTIRRFAEHLNPRAMRIVALNKPTAIERKQWYFNRYIKQLPNAGEIVFFDRSWYNRAVVEPVMGFCDKEQYQRFMAQVPDFEHMLYEAGTIIIKFWFSISKEEQLARFQRRLNNPLKKWKYSPVDEKGQELWSQYSYYKNQMLSGTHTVFSPWVIVKADDKRLARVESIRYVLSRFEYDNKNISHIRLTPDPGLVMRYFRQTHQIDN